MGHKVEQIILCRGTFTGFCALSVLKVLACMSLVSDIYKLNYFADFDPI